MLIKVYRKNRPFVKLRRVDETHNAWVFDFVDPIHKFQQSVIFPKVAPGEAMEDVWGRIHDVFTERIKETEWLNGRRIN